MTLDDLPWSGPSVNEGVRTRGTASIIGSLSDRGVPASGFVNCANIRGNSSILRAWLAAGVELGNHTARHLDIDRVGSAAWLEDVRDCDVALRTLTGRPPRFFRYPMLRQGATRARRDSAARALSSMGYVNAHVTIDNSESRIALAYRLASEANDREAMTSIADIYVRHLRAAFLHAREVAKRKLRRDGSHVLLLHLNQLNADHIGAALDSLAADGAEFVPLDTVLGDALYSLPDLYVGGRGWSWLYRIAPFDPADAVWDDVEAARVDTLLRQSSGSPRRINRH
ncbi:MAG: polysaccharide deacetylase family protein [Gemmatimonadaceae bacterium]|nr:polysaccharide deacetylase family protein [Gemmatimonadaceae bacterium]